MPHPPPPPPAAPPRAAPPQPPPHPRQYPPPRSVADLPDFSQPASGLPSVATRPVATSAKKPAVEPQLPPYRPVSNRLRGWILLLTLVTVVAIAALMLRPQWRLLAAKAERAERAEKADRAKRADVAAPAACPPDAASAAPGCPGSHMPVLMLPAAPPAASGRR